MMFLPKRLTSWRRRMAARPLASPSFRPSEIHFSLNSGSLSASMAITSSSSVTSGICTFSPRRCLSTRLAQTVRARRRLRYLGPLNICIKRARSKDKSWRSSLRSMRTKRLAALSFCRLSSGVCRASTRK